MAAKPKTKKPVAPKHHEPLAGLTVAEAQEVIGSQAGPTNALAAAMATGNPDLLYATKVALGLAPAARPSVAEE